MNLKNRNSFLGWIEDIVEKEKKCWLPAFYPFLTMFSTSFFFKVIKSWDFVEKG